MNEFNRDFTRVKTSSIHGRGVFAKRIIPKGTRIFEYAGARVLKSSLATDLAAELTSLAYVMNLNETTAIDGERGGNDARFINHSCNPNCEVLYFNETPYIYSICQIDIDEELSFDYQYDAGPDAFLSEEEKRKWFPCCCGAENCRGTLIHD